MTNGLPPLVLASQNTKKIKELQTILGTYCEVRSCRPHITWTENGSSFADNAKIKCAAVRAAETGMVLADDSGLVVEALGGAPGLYSSRFSGPDATDQQNYLKLLYDLQGTPMESRQAYFICSLALLNQKGVFHVFEGRLHGRIALEPAGSEGFGYDPVFIPEGFNKSLAQFDTEEKNAISHRAIALGKLKEFLTSK